jgi:hypothetical protein
VPRGPRFSSSICASSGDRRCAILVIPPIVKQAASWRWSCRGCCTRDSSG